MEANLAALAIYQISNFFKKNAPVTQEQCDLEAKRITGQSVYTTKLQGGASYTVVSSDETCIVQFRASHSALDMNVIGYIETAYDGFTPRHQIVGKMGELYVYTMNNVGGVSMYLARDDFDLLKNTVQDFARYVRRYRRPLHSPYGRKCAADLTLADHTGFSLRHGTKRRKRCHVRVPNRYSASTHRNSPYSRQGCPSAFARH